MWGFMSSAPSPIHHHFYGYHAQWLPILMGGIPTIPSHGSSLRPQRWHQATASHHSSTFWRYVKIHCGFYHLCRTIYIYTYYIYTYILYIYITIIIIIIIIILLLYIVDILYIYAMYEHQTWSHVPSFGWVLFGIELWALHFQGWPVKNICTMWGPPVISWFRFAPVTIVISTINHSYWRYKPT